MKIAEPGKNSSFYESFSDLIFATMAIFVLLMVLFLLQMSAAEAAVQADSNRIDDLEEELEKAVAEKEEAIDAASEAQEQAEEAQEQAEEAKKKQNEAENEKNNLLASPVDLVIAVDGTSSMKETLENISETVEAAATIAARLSPRFRMGLVIYREPNPRSTCIMPMTEIAPSPEGEKSEGMKDLGSFLHDKALTVWNTRGGRGDSGGELFGESFQVSRLTPLKNRADVEYALQESIRLFDDSGDSAPDTRRVFILIGDVGPWEKGDIYSASEAVDIRSRNKSYDMVRRFASRQDDLTFLSLFEESSDPDNDWHAGLSHEFFDKLAQEAGEGKGYFGKDASQIYKIIVQAVIGDQE